MGDIGEQRAHYDVLPVRELDTDPMPTPDPGPIPDPFPAPDPLPDPPERRER
jgi:hypothetical protein